MAQFFEAAVAAYGDAPGQPQRAANWMTGELFRLLYADGDGQDLRQIAAIKLQPAQLAALLKLVDDKVINPNTAKKVLEGMYATGDDPQAIVAREGLAMVSDTSVIDDAIQRSSPKTPTSWGATAAAKSNSSASSWARSCAPPKARPTPMPRANGCKNCWTANDCAPFQVAQAWFG